MPVDISQTKTRTLIFGAVFAAATVLSGNFAAAGVAGLVIEGIGGIAGNIGASDLGEWIKCFRQNQKILDDPHLTLTVGRAISLVILNTVNCDDELIKLVENKGLSYPQDSLRKIAKNVEKKWVKLSQKTISDSNDIDIHESHLVAMFANDVQSFHEIKALDIATWEQILCWLGDQVKVSLHEDIISYIASKLYHEFPTLFRDVLKYDADNEGEAFAQMLLNLHGEALGALKKVLSGNQQIIDTLEKIAKRKNEDITVVLHTIQLRFDNIDDLIKQSFEELQQSKLQASESKKNPQDSQQGKRIFISYKRDAQPDEQVALQVLQALSPQHQVFIDQKMLVGTRWAEKIEVEIRQADYLIVLLSSQSVHSEMLEKEIRMAHDFGQVQEGSPVILPVRLNYHQPFQYPLSAYLNNINWAFWQDTSDTPRLIEELKQAVAGDQLTIDKVQSKIELIQESKPSSLPRPFSAAQPPPLEMPSGTMDTSSPYYIERPTDAIALKIIERLGVTITIKGARQVGKSSLLIRTIDAAVKAGKRVAFLDFQLFDKAALNDATTFFRRFCSWLADVLEIEDKVDEYWNPELGNSQCCTRYLSRYVLKELSQPLVLAMDEVDKVFDSDFRSDFFGMLRSWHNSRATMARWKNLDLVLVTSTEPYQLINDLNQSPFNVGEVMELADFTPSQVADLNQRHGLPLNPNEEKQLMMLLGGHPYLIRKSLYLVTSGQISATELFTNTTAEGGFFGDHLRYLLSLLHNKMELIQGLLGIINHSCCKDKLIFWRLRGAGLVRESGKKVLPRCQLYADYFRDNLYV